MSGQSAQNQPIGGAGLELDPTQGRPPAADQPPAGTGANTSSVAGGQPVTAPHGSRGGIEPQLPLREPSPPPYTSDEEETAPAWAGGLPSPAHQPSHASQETLQPGAAQDVAPQGRYQAGRGQARELYGTAQGAAPPGHLGLIDQTLDAEVRRQRQLHNGQLVQLTNVNSGHAQPGDGQLSHYNPPPEAEFQTRNGEWHQQGYEAEAEYAQLGYNGDAGRQQAVERQVDRQNPPPCRWLPSSQGRVGPVSGVGQFD